MNTCLGTMAGSIIQTTGKMDFNDVMRMGIQSELRNVVKNACSKPRKQQGSKDYCWSGSSGYIQTCVQFDKFDKTVVLHCRCC